VLKTDLTPAQAPKELDGQVWDDAGWMLSGLSGL